MLLSVKIMILRVVSAITTKMFHKEKIAGVIYSTRTNQK